MTVIPIIVDVFGTVLKSLEKRLEELESRGRIEVIQNTALLEYSEKSSRPDGPCCPLDYGKKPQLTLVGKTYNE